MPGWLGRSGNLCVRHGAVAGQLRVLGGFVNVVSSMHGVVLRVGLPSPETHIVGLVCIAAGLPQSVGQGGKSGT
eukprot:COSAG01_NODE_31104_length_603_cov_5.349206_2_plen_73_part_01